MRLSTLDEHLNSKVVWMDNGVVIKEGIVEFLTKDEFLVASIMER